MSYPRIVLLFVAALAVLPPISSASDAFAGQDFSLRYSAALNHFEPYADVAANGGASAASLFGSSNNPAAIAWRFPDASDGKGAVTHFNFGASAEYSNVAFDNGTLLNFSSMSATFGTKDIGVFRFDVGLITSNEDAVRNVPANFKFDLGGARLNYSKMLTKDLSVGATAGFARSETEFKGPGFDFADATKNIWNFRFGTVWSPADKWYLGLNTTYIYGPTDTTTLTPTAIGLLRRSSSDATHQFTVQPGIAYNWKMFGLVHLDYELAHFSNDTGHLTENRFMAGLDIPLKEFLYLRGGGFTDAKGNAGWTTGLGFYPSTHVFIDLAYQSNNFPEVGQEFGRSRTLNASVTVQW